MSFTSRHTGHSRTPLSSEEKNNPRMPAESYLARIGLASKKVISTEDREVKANSPTSNADFADNLVITFV